ncbi:septation protein SepH [Oerskovia sp. NPDC060287]|uniref:septation protein SepH n=1 Tax=Oerskovia sp. NPDC060287 TaxID=3347095 RepID=UPI003661CD13
MSELELVRVHEDGEHLVLAGPDGARFTLPIDDALRGAMRRDRAQLEQLRSQSPDVLPVREIQAQLRAGLSAREVAEKAGIPIEQVHRFEGPVLAEQEYVVAQVLKNRAGHDEDSPTLGEVVSERLTARGVAEDDVEWSAARSHAGPWTVTALFLIGDRARSARWSYDPQNRALHALEDEARWLSGTDVAEEPVRGVRGALFDHSARGGQASAAPSAPSAPSASTPADAADPADAGDGPSPLRAETDSTSSMLDDLSQRRGVRQHRDEPSAPFEGFGPPQTFDLGERSGRRDEVDEDEEPAGAKVFSLSKASRKEQRPEPDGGAHDATSSHRDTGHPAGTGHRGSRETDDAHGSTDAHPAREGGAETSTTRPGAASHGGRDVVGTVRDERDGPDATGEHGERPAPRTGEPRRPRKTRASVPSWDEIVFGAKPEH